MLGVIPCTRLGYLCALCSLRVSNTLRVIFAPLLGYALPFYKEKANNCRVREYNCPSTLFWVTCHTTNKGLNRHHYHLVTNYA